MQNEIGLSRGIVLSPVGPLFGCDGLKFSVETKKLNGTFRFVRPCREWGTQKASSEEMLISDQQLKIEFSFNSFFL